MASALGQELGRDEAAQSGVLGLVNHTHAPDAQLLDDLVVRNGLASIGVTRLRQDWHRLYLVWMNDEGRVTDGGDVNLLV